MKTMKLSFLLLVGLVLCGHAQGPQALIQSQGQGQALIQSQSDLSTLRTMVDEILADPENQQSRRLLQQLVQEKLILQYQDVQSRRELALEQGLKLSGELGASAETNQQLMRALESINPQAFKSLTSRITRMRAQKLGEVARSAQGMFVALLREALKYYEQGQEDEGFVTLITALTLHPTLPGAIASVAKVRRVVPAHRVELVKVSTQAPAAAPAAATNYYKLISPEESALAQQYFRQGIRLYGGGKLEEAAQSFREALAHDPNNEWIKRSLERTSAELKMKGPRPAAKEARPKAEEKPAAAEKKSAEAEEKPAAEERPAQASTPAGAGMPYVTQRGDNFWKLAKRFYSDARKWRLIQDANPQFKGPLPTGVDIVIPQFAKATAEASAQPAQALAVEGPRQHVVEKGDTLWKLAQKYYGDANQWEFILKANPRIKDENVLEKGAVLVMPALPKGPVPENSR